jgi:predicted GNAT superfamily acetyltransferase
LVRIPEDYAALRAEVPAAATAWRDAAAEALEACFAAGLTAVAFSREYGYLFT